jgi:cobyrinic acid a,c-diamide synthase
MYLTEGIFDTADRFWKMAGIFPVCARMGKKRAGLGYREVRMQDDSFFGPAGTIMRGHEFHYSIIDGMPAHIHRLYAVNNGSFEGYRYKNVLGGYIHLHFGFTPKAAAAFIKTCQG